MLNNFYFYTDMCAAITDNKPRGSDTKNRGKEKKTVKGGWQLLLTQHVRTEKTVVKQD